MPYGGTGLGLIDTILAHGAGGPVPAALENHPEIIASADIGCYAYPRRETQVPAVHGTEPLV